MLCASLDGRGVWGRKDTRICMSESLHCSPETITALLINYTPIQKFFFLSLRIFFFLYKAFFLNWRIVDFWGFPDGSVSKELPAMQETRVWSLGWEDPLEKGKTTLYSEEFHGLYSPKSVTKSRVRVAELDTTERLSLHFHVIVDLFC